MDGLSSFATQAVPKAPTDAGLNAGGAGTVVGIIRQALISRDSALLGEALNAPVKPEDSCKVLDPRLAVPLLGALTSRLELGAGDTRTLEWVGALLKEHRTTIGASKDGEGSIETLRSVCDRASHSLKRLLRLRGKLALLEQSSADNDAGETRLVTWDEKEEAMAPMDIDDDDEDEDDEDEDDSSSLVSSSEDESSD
jgi:hypothetical protein